MSRLTRWIRSMSSVLFTPATMERLIVPILSDMETERRAAVVGGRRWRSRWILLDGCLGLGKAIALHGWHVLVRAAVTEESTAGVVRVVVGVFVILTAAFTLAPVFGAGRGHLELGLYAVPQAIPLSIPLAVAFAIAWRWLRHGSPLSARSALVLGVVGSGLAFAAMQWAVPNANQAFRVAVAQRLGDGVRSVPRGVNELSLSEMAGLLRTSSDSHGAGGVMDGPLAAGAADPDVVRSALHVRIAFGLATAILALFAIAMARLASAPRMLGIVFVGIVFAYMLAFVRLSSVSRIHPLMVWIPNALLGALSVALLFASSLRRGSSSANYS